MKTRGGSRVARRAAGRAWRRLVVVPAVLALTACGARGPGAEQYPELAPYAGDEVVALRFVAHLPFSADTLAELIQTTTTHCDLAGLGICFPFTDWGEVEAHLDLGVLRQDVLVLEAFYRRNGFFGTRVVPGIDERGESRVAVEFNILRGDSIILDSLSIEGVAEALDTAALRDRIPLEVGQLFDLDEFVQSADTLIEALYARGYANAEILRNYAVDTVADRARVWLVGVPGPQVRIDSIIVRGVEHLGRTGALRQMVFAEGDLLRLDELTRSQRNLFGLDLIQFATVAVADDSLQLTPETDSTETVLIRVEEAPVYVVDASLGYGSVDCIRAHTQWTSRSFLGGARRLVLSGDVSKVGIGDPVDLGLESSLCQAFDDDPFHSSIDYRAAANLTQPFFLSPRNRLNGLLFAEQTSEPNLFQRQAYGAEFTVSHRINARDFAAFVLDGEYARTRASDAVFCFAFAVCRREDFVALQEFRWRNALGATYTFDRADRAIDPTSGYAARAGVLYSPRWLASDIPFLRVNGEASWYMSPRPDWVLAAHLRLGDFLGTVNILPDSTTEPGDLLPPEERFYAGGPSSVRGYERNLLGAPANPGVWVAEGVETDTLTGAIKFDSITGQPQFRGGDPVFIPLGGSALAVANLELRLPSPFLSDHLRWAVFVDVGAISTGTLADIQLKDVRITPGIGVRIQTPVGPARVDLAIRPYYRYEAPLLVPDPQMPTRLLRLREQYRPLTPSTWWGQMFERLQLHIAVGQPF